MLLQKVEAQFKALLIHSRLQAGPDPEIAAKQSERSASIAKSTPGMLVAKFKDEVLASDTEPEAVMPSASFIGSASFNYTIGANEAYKQQRILALDKVVEERNDLVHHLLPKWQCGLLESGRTIDLHLDQQHSRVAAESKVLQTHFAELQSARVLMQNFLASPEFEEAFEMRWLQLSPLVESLAAMSRNAKSTAGWVQLSAAGVELWAKAPEDMTGLQSMYGFKKLKPLLVACALFDLQDEQLQTGGNRTLFRLKPAVISN